MAPVIASILKGFTARMVSGLGKEGKKLDSAAQKFTYGFGKGFQDSFYKKANAVRLGHQFSETISKMFDQVFGAESARALRESARQSSYNARRIGVSASGLANFGQGLGAYGGGENDIAGSIKALNAKMTGLNFGEAGFLKDLMMLTNGQFNVYGSGPRGFKTGEEMHDEFARWANEMQKNGTFDPGIFERVANQLSISNPVRDAILDGEYQNMKMRTVLTKEEIDNAAAVAKARAKAEIETARLMKRLGVLGAEIRQPLDELGNYIQKNLFGWLADKLTPTKSEKEVEDNVKNNAAAIDATLTGGTGGLDSSTAKNARQEAALRLSEKMKSGLSDEDAMAQATLWAKAEGIEDNDEIRKTASMIYSAAKIGKSKYAVDDRFSSNVDYSKFFNDKIKTGIDSQKIEEEAFIDNQKKLPGIERRIEYLSGLRDSMNSGNEWGATKEYNFESRRKDLSRVTPENREKYIKETRESLDREITSLERRKKLFNTSINIPIPILDRQKGSSPTQESSGFIEDIRSGRKFELPTPNDARFTTPFMPSNGGATGGGDVSVKGAETIHVSVTTTESINDPNAFSKDLVAKLEPAFQGMLGSVLQKSSYVLSAESTTGVSGNANG